MKYRASYRNERAAANFVDVCGEILKETLVDDLLSAKYYSVLMDGSTDASVTEQELIYVLYLSKNGRPHVKFFNIESVKSADAEGLKSSLNESFERIGITNFGSRLHGLNVDGASVNTGIHNGLGALIKNELAPWLTVIHCFSHRLELAVKDSFKNSFFYEIDTMLLKLYYLYKKSPKRLRELNQFGEIFEKVVPKPSKAADTRWIVHKLNAMEKVLSNYGVFITHLESLSQTDSQALKRAELVGFSKRWVQAKYPIHLAIYLDILQPIKVLSLTMQQEIHDPVIQLKHIREFNWSMGKLQGLLNQSIDGNTIRLTNYTKFLKDVVHEDGEHKYQGIKLLNFDASNERIKNSYSEIIDSLTSAMSNRFENLQSHPVFKNIHILDCSRWPKDDANLSEFGESQIKELSAHFSALLQDNGCDLDKILPEWDLLKLEISQLMSGMCTVKYLDVWEQLFTSQFKKLYGNALHVIELLLITPTTNAKLERMFSRMNRVKNDWRNRLSRERLENNLRIGEDGPLSKDFDPEAAIERWYNQKVRRIGAAKPHKYPQKRQKIGKATSSVDVVTYCLSDFESDSDEES